MSTQTDLILTAAMLEQGLRVYHISLHPRAGAKMPTTGNVAISFLPFAEGELVICESSTLFFCARVERICESFDIDEIAQCRLQVVGSAEEAYRRASDWNTRRAEAKRRIATASARSAARQMLEESGMKAHELFQITDQKEMEE